MDDPLTDQSWQSREREAPPEALKGSPTGYVLLDYIGGGGFGVVYAVRRLADGADLVIKYPASDCDEQDLWRFRREVRLQSQLVHENIVRVLDYDLEGTPPWFVMERADASLDQLLPHLQDSLKLRLFLQALDAMVYAHGNHVLHRDLKPSNMLVHWNDDGEVRLKVSDFGLGRPFTRKSPEQTKSGFFAGTPGYYPPEQRVDFQNADERADVYALGRVLDDIRRTLSDRVLAGRLEYCIRRATAELVVDRYSRVAQMREDIRLIIERPNAFERPEDEAVKLIQQALSTDGVSNPAARPLVELLFNHRSNQRFLLRIMPRIPTPLLMELIRRHSVVMKDILASYDRQLQGPIPKDYAATAVTVLEQVATLSPDAGSRALAVSRIIGLAFTYDLWDAGFAAARLLSGEHDPAALMSIAGYLSEHLDQANWCEIFLRDVTLPDVLAVVIHRPR